MIAASPPLPLSVYLSRMDDLRAKLTPSEFSLLHMVASRSVFRGLRSCRILAHEFTDGTGVNLTPPTIRQCLRTLSDNGFMSVNVSNGRKQGYQCDPRCLTFDWPPDQPTEAASSDE